MIFRLSIYRLLGFRSLVLYFLLAFLSCKESPKKVLDPGTSKSMISNSTSKDTREMNTSNNVIITAEELFKVKGESNLVLVDARYGKTAKEDYGHGHLADALYVDLNDDLSDIKDNAANGGRHPLPSLEKFANTLTGLGISPQSHVVVYDANHGGLAAARFWWMLTAIGHSNVQVLDGGLAAAVKIGYPITTKIKTPKTIPLYKIEGWKAPIATMGEVEAMAKSTSHKIIDVRAKDRYLGITEPIDLVAGHIPGAVNVPFTENVNERGRFLSPELLKAKYQRVLDSTPIENITVHCGSGVTACHTLLAFAHSGYALPNLYVGSWSEWSRNNKPIATNN